MRDLVFSSVLPYINKELSGAITDVKRGNGKKGDAHYYIICGQRIIGIKVVIDAYPDIYDVGSLFDDDVSEQVLAKAMYEHGYECAVAKIGIGANDQVRFARRIFLKNDGYYFNYQQLRFVKYDPQASDRHAASGIRYCLSPAPKDESWKKIAGFEYTEPPKTVSGDALCSMRIQRPAPQKDYAKMRTITAFWDDERVLEKVAQMCKASYICADRADEMSQLICYAASTAHNKIGPDDMLNYVCNAVDLATGMFLSDSAPIPQHEILIVLKNIFEKVELASKYEVAYDEAALIMHLIYIFLTNREKFRELLRHDYLAEYKGQRRPSIGHIYHSTKDAFLADPRKFGHGQDVIDEIARLQDINSPQNLEKYVALKAAVELDMHRFCALHESILTRKKLQMMGKTEEEQLRRFRSKSYDLMKFIEDNFDSRSADAQKRAMDSFCAVVSAYQQCIIVDEMIIDRQLHGRYGLFERSDDAKRSKAQFEKFMLQWHH